MLEFIVSLWHHLISMLPFAWTEYEFMRTALLGILIVSPLFAIVGTMVISNRMTFFSDVLGHTALTGIAIGVLAGLVEPLWTMIAFAVLLALVFNIMKLWTKASSDTILGVLFSATVALGIVILSRNGGFNKYTAYLIGDILAITPVHIFLLFIFFLLVLAYWVFFGNRLLLVCLNNDLAKSRSISPFLLETSFSLLLAILIILAIKIVGVLIISAMLVLPAAAARNIARNVCSYTIISVFISLFSGITGLVLSYYFSTASGATIVLVAASMYIVTSLVGIIGRKIF